MKCRLFFTGLLALGLSLSSSASDAEIDACANASDKLLCVAKIFNRKLDLIASAVKVVSITYFDESNCTVPWGTATISIQNVWNPGAVEQACAGVAEQVRTVASSTFAIASVMAANGTCQSGLDISRTDSPAVIADCVRRFRTP